MGRRILFTVCIACAAAACADADGRDPYAMFRTFTHAEGLYSFRYLAPPWTLTKDDAKPDLQIIAVEADAEAMDTAVETGSIHARFKGVVSLRSRTSAREEAEADLELLSEIDHVDIAVTSFQNKGGRTGFHLSATMSDRNIRAVYFDSAGRTATVMQIVGRESLESDDFTLLLRSLEPNGEIEETDE